MSLVGGISPIGATGGVGGINYTPSTSGAQVNAGAAQQASPDIKTDEGSEEVKQKKRLGIIECETCNSRTYQDGSDDPGVSFKAPTQLTPSEAATAVPAHEREHFTREAADAKENEREVVSNNIQIFTSVCPECGRTYVSGGLTTTVTKPKNQQSEQEKAMEKLFGNGGNDESNPNSVEGINRSIANKAYGLNFDKKK